MRKRSCLPAVPVFSLILLTQPIEAQTGTKAPDVRPSNGGQELTFELPGGVPLVMVRVPAGTFQMGSPTTEIGREDDETPHQVTIRPDYYVGKYEVTQEQWKAVMGSSPSHFSSCGGHCPVEQVSWDDIRGTNGFIAKLNRLLGTTAFRLPTEAEWERAARAGSKTRFSFGDAPDEGSPWGANSVADPHAWWSGNSGDKTHPVGTRRANPYGLFDLHGNVTEWVEDWYGAYPSTAQTNPQGPTAGPTTGPCRVVRGGSYTNTLHQARSAYHACSGPQDRVENLGFRLARSL